MSLQPSTLNHPTPAALSPGGPVVPWSTSLWRLGLPLALFGVLWVDLIRQLSYQWDASEQYAYGWFVPFLALGLFLKRWSTRPSPELPASHFLPSAFCLLPCILLLPLRVIHEINPDWPLASWLLTLLAVSLSLCAVYLAGGWPWIRHFAFPVCFILIAVRWPYRIEHGLTQGLMQVVASLTVEIIGWFDIPAFQRGNLIEISTGMVGIDEACSGIRSFQSTLMAALFLGELYLLTWPRRASLLVGGVILSFCLNVVRTLILTWQAATSGLSALEKWHDPAGLMIFLVSFAALCALALWLRPKASSVVPSPLRLDRGEGQGEVSTSVPQPSTLNLQPASASPVAAIPLTVRPVTQHSSFVIRHSSLRNYLVAVGLWSLFCIAVTEVWYRSHEPKQVGLFHWSASFPTNQPAFKPIQLAERTTKIIGHDAGGGATWSDESGLNWSVYFFRWNPTSIESLLRARIHRPERCLPASGLRQVADGGLQNFAAAGLNLPFRCSTYEAEGRTLYVFFCQWEDGSEQQGGVWESKLADRLRSVLVGRRKLGQQTMEVILSGPPTLDQATAVLRNALPGLVQSEPNQPVASKQ